MNVNTAENFSVGDRPVPPIQVPDGSQSKWLRERPVRLPMPERAEMLNFIRSFYQQLLTDQELGPIFKRVVGSTEEQWAGHYETMADFWLAVVFDGPAFRGNPMVKHAAIADISPHHFERWLTVFEATARSYWPSQAASLFIMRARQIAPALTAGIERAREKNLVKQWH
jgi:hemoglobin